MMIVRNTLRAIPFLFAAMSAWATGPVDINSADAKTLADTLVGVGPAKAEAIVAYRDQLGPFLTVEDLTLVKGIGEATVERNRELLTVSVPAKR